MKFDLQMTEPRSAVILRFTRHAIRERQLVVTSFAAEVVERYLASHEVHERVVTFREPAGDVDAISDAMKHNAQIVDRHIKGLIKTFPADLEEAWTDALPAAYRLACQRELVRRLGFLGALARPAQESPHASMADVMHEFAEFVGVVGRVLMDGEITQEERTEVLREISDAQSALESFKQQLLQAGERGRVVEMSPGLAR